MRANYDKTEIEITPEMIAAWVARLQAKMGNERWTGGDADVVSAVFSAMLAEYRRRGSERG